EVPGLGEPNAAESNSLAVINLEDPAQPRLMTFLPTGLPFGGRSAGGSSPSGVAATADRVFVTNAHNDSVTIINAGTLRVENEIALRIPGLESLRGVLPIGVSFHEASGRLLVAEAGINAIGVLDVSEGKVLGHIPACWFPTRVITRGATVYTSNAKGFGTGPNADLKKSFQGEMRRGTITVFAMPKQEELARLTKAVYSNNGFNPASQPAQNLPEQLRNVVIIVKENRTFDEVFGDISGTPELARYGAAVTPNHHHAAERWAISDNFYADSEVSVDGHHWIVGSYPNAWTESSLMASYGGQKDFRLPTTAPGRLIFPESSSSVHPEEQLEAGAIWHHLERHGISFRNFGEGFELAGVNEGEGLKPTGARYFTNVPMPGPLFRNTSRDYPQYNMNIP
ncbi:MAG: bifunctional YncE family protein/alkaline phosphatase family protein, partial [Bryobacteraceae bacterium]